MRVVVAVLLGMIVGGCVTTVAPPVGTPRPISAPPATFVPVASPTTSIATPVLPPASVAVPSPTIAGATTEVPLLPDPSVDGETVLTLGDTATVETVSTLEILEATVGYDTGTTLPQGQVAYTFLVRFAYTTRTPGPTEIGGGYYNHINFTMRDDQSFEYPQMNSMPGIKLPALLFGDLTFGQQVQGWVTIWGPRETSFVELVYSPVASEPVVFRMLVP